MSFKEWWRELAELTESVNWKLGQQEEYREYYDDGDSPAYVFKIECQPLSPSDD
jgi:hypothetical protein